MHHTPSPSVFQSLSAPTRRWATAPQAGLALCAVAVAVALLLSPLGSQAQSDAASATPKPAMTVTVETPRQQAWTRGLTANGSVAAWQEASVGTEANGLRLAEVRTQVGDTVKAGQVLAVFDDQGVKAELAQARAGLAEAQANAAEAQANAERARSLQATGAMSEQQIAQYTTAAVTAQARVDSAQANLAVQSLRLKHTQVLAPDSGVVSARSATVGAVLPAGTELYRLIRQGRLEWRAEVPAAELDRVKVGQAVALTAASGAVAKGKVRTVGPTVDPQTRAALVYVDLLPGTPASIKAGMFATGELALGQTAATTVPQQAVVNRDGFTYLYVLADDAAPGQRVQRLKVQVGRRVGERVEVVSGLPTTPPAPRVVTQGAGFLSDGDVVKVVSVAVGEKK